MIFVATSPAEWVAKSMDRLIDRSAWNRNSAKFTVAICPALSRTPGPIGRGEHDLALSPAPNATFGARICYKLLRLATGSTSENSPSTNSGKSGQEEGPLEERQSNLQQRG